MADLVLSRVIATSASETPCSSLPPTLSSAACKLQNDVKTAMHTVHFTMYTCVCWLFRCSVDSSDETGGPGLSHLCRGLMFSSECGAEAEAVVVPMEHCRRVWSTTAPGQSRGIFCAQGRSAQLSAALLCGSVRAPNVKVVDCAPPDAALVALRRTESSAKTAEAHPWTHGERRALTSK